MAEEDGGSASWFRELAGRGADELLRLRRRRNSLLFIKETNPLRVHVTALVNHPAFDRCVLALIGANCLTLAMYDPTASSSSARAQNLEVVENVFLAAFTVETLLKIISVGFFLGPKTYLSNSWNWLDFVVVVTGYLNFLPGMANFSGVRALRALRPLRTIDAIPGLKLLVVTLLDSLPLLANVILLVFWVILVFGIIAVSTWSGALTKRCFAAGADGAPLEGSAPLGPRTCSMSGSAVGSYGCGDGEVCGEYGRNPNDGFTQFDSFPWAMLQIFQVITLQGWDEQLWYTLDAGGGFAYVYFVLLIVLGSYFCLNLFTAVISAKFSQLSAQWRNEMAGTRGFKKNRLLILIRRNAIVRAVFLKDWWQHRYKEALYEKVVDAKWFNKSIMALIFLSTLFMATESYGQADYWTSFLKSSNYVFTTAFTVEMVLKLAAMGPIVYFSEAFNYVDAVVVIGSLVEILAGGAVSLSILRTVRMVRVVRGTKLVKSSKTLRKLLYTIIEGIKALKDFGLLLGLFVFVFVVLGMQMFGGKPEFEGSRRNFDNIGEGSITVIEMLTGNAWFHVMWLAMKASSEPMGAIYSVLWLCAGKFMLATLFIAILINSFQTDEADIEKSEAAAAERAAFAISDDQEDGETEVDDVRRNMVEKAKQQRFLFETFRVGRWLSETGQWEDEWEYEEEEYVNSLGELINENEKLHTRVPVYKKFAPYDLAIEEKIHKGIEDDIAEVEGTPLKAEEEDSPAGDSDYRDGPPKPAPKEESLREAKPTFTSEPQKPPKIEGPPPADSRMQREPAPPVRVKSLPPPPKPPPQTPLDRLHKLKSMKQSPQPRAKPSDALEVSDVLEGGLPWAKYVNMSIKQRKANALTAEILGWLQETPWETNQNRSSASSEEPAPAPQASTPQATGAGDTAAASQPAQESQTRKDPGAGAVIDIEHSPPAGSAVESTSPPEIPNVVVTVQEGESYGATTGQTSEPEAAYAGDERHPLGVGSGAVGDAVETSTPSGGTMIGPGPVTEAVIKKNANVQKALASSAEKYKQDLIEKGRRKSLAPDSPGAESIPEGDEEEEAPPAYLSHRALYCLEPENPFRKLCTKLATHPRFESLILTCIMISSLCLALDKPSLDSQSGLGQFLYIIDTIFTIIFTLELTLKVVTMGLFAHEGSYLRSGWNRLDFVIVLSSLISSYVQSSTLKAFRTLRMLRTLRPLRMVSRLQGMRIVVSAIMYSAPAATNVCIFGLFMFCIYAILGVQLFMGGLGYCSDLAATDKDDCLSRNSIEIPDPRFGVQEGAPVWRTAVYNFDNTIQALVSLFVVTAGDGWTSIMWNAMDSAGKDKQPQENKAWWAAVYFIFFVVLSSFFWLNLLVAAIVDSYTVAQYESGRALFVTDDQKKWKEAFKFQSFHNTIKIRKTVSQEELPAFRRMCLDLVNKPSFEYVIIGAILLNTVFLTFEHEGQPDGLTTFLFAFNIIFTVMFALEAAVKIIALTFKNYWLETWNRFDFFISFLSVADLIVFAASGDGVGVASVFRIFRVARLFKLVQSARGLRALFNTFVQSLPAVANVGTLWLLFLFVFAVLGMNLFGDEDHTGAITTHVNFDDFSHSLSTMFIAFTLTWAALQERLYCGHGDYPERACSYTIAPPLFFCAFIVLGTYILLNLIIAVVLDQFVEIAVDEGLLNTEGFFDVLRRKMLLERFTSKLHKRIKTKRAAKKNWKVAQSIMNVEKGASDKLHEAITKEMASKARKDAADVKVTSIIGQAKYNADKKLQAEKDAAGLKPYPALQLAVPDGGSFAGSGLPSPESTGILPVDRPADKQLLKMYALEAVCALNFSRNAAHLSPASSYRSPGSTSRPRAGCEPPLLVPLPPRPGTPEESVPGTVAEEEPEPAEDPRGPRVLQRTATREMVAMPQCVSCGEANAGGASAVCASCGSNLVRSLNRFCTSCGAANPGGAVVCGCGGSLLRAGEVPVTVHKFCTSCGQRNEGNSMACAGCGSALVSAPQ